MKFEKGTALYAIVLGGLVAGTIDVGAASAINLLSPITILHAIASGLIGKVSFSGGATTAALGLLLQWGMALIIAAIYVGATSARPGLRTRWMMSGTVAGVIIFFVMNYLVMPLSAAPFRPKFGLEEFITRFHGDIKFAENMIAMIVFGLIVAFIAKDLRSDTQG